MRRLAATQGLLLEVEVAGDGHSLGFGFSLQVQKLNFDREARLTRSSVPTVVTVIKSLCSYIMEDISFQRLNFNK